MRLLPNIINTFLMRLLPNMDYVTKNDLFAYY